MGRKPRVTDFSGHSYQRPQSIIRSEAKSFRCDSCGKLQFLTPRVLSRAARPRCVACGGMLIESESSEARTIGKKSERNAKAKEMDRAITALRTNIVCWSCGTR